MPTHVLAKACPKFLHKVSPNMRWALTISVIPDENVLKGLRWIILVDSNQLKHGLRTPREEIAFTARPIIQSQSQIFRYGRSIFCLPHWPHFSDIFDLCIHWVSVVCKLKEFSGLLERSIRNTRENLILPTQCS